MTKAERILNAEEVAKLYEAGMSTPELGRKFGLGAKTIHSFMVKHAIPRRPFRKSQKTGADSRWWKGDSVAYGRAHVRVRKIRGTPNHCEECGTTRDGGEYEWHNPTKTYTDINSYIRLCRSCHAKADKFYLNLGHYLNGANKCL